MKASWMDAKAACQQAQGQLIPVKSATKQQLLWVTNASTLFVSTGIDNLVHDKVLDEKACLESCVSVPVFLHFKLGLLSDSRIPS